MDKPIITNLKQITEFCPAQRHGRTVDDRPAYIRFKHGFLSANIGPVGGTIDDAIRTPRWFEGQVDRDREDGIELDKVCPLTGITIL